MTQTHQLDSSVKIKQYVVVTLICGVFGGAALSPLLMQGIPLMRQMTDPAAEKFGLVLIVSLGSGLLFLPGLLAYSITHGKGIAFLTQLLVGIVMGVLTPYFGDMLFSNVLTGVLLEATIFAVTRYKPTTYKLMGWIGASLSILAAIGSFIGHGALGLTLLQATAIGVLTIFAFVGLALAVQFWGDRVQNLGWINLFSAQEV
ncbi:MAG: hypothetical protein AAGD96_03040 [Chloroflexota bacterium]